MKTKRARKTQGFAILWPLLSLAVIILPGLAAIIYLVLYPNWTAQCAAQAAMPPPSGAATAPADPTSLAAAGVAGGFTDGVAGTLEDSAPYHECAVTGVTIAAGITIGLFAVVVLLWWKFTELRGLKRLFEVPWLGLDDGDAKSVGAIESVVRAAAFTFVLLAGLSVVAISAAKAWNIDLLHWERKKDTPPSKPCVPSTSSCTLSIAPSTITTITTEIRQELGASTRALVAAINAQTEMQHKALAEGAAKIDTLNDHVLRVSGDLKEITKQIETGADAVGSGLKEIARSIDRLADRANPPSTVRDKCFTPEFRRDSGEGPQAEASKRLQHVSSKSNAARQTWSIRPDARFRVVTELTVYFDTGISELTAGAKGELNRFLTDMNVGKTALSIRGGADRQGERTSNVPLSRDRAVNVATYVVDDERYPPIVGLNWFGEDAPRQPTDPGLSEPYNRTVHVKVLQTCQ
jgi:outer membrane protein OmpA-like peptidoglycan-associated protein